jgi:predicted ArsR family transcriptional regulator
MKNTQKSKKDEKRNKTISKRQAESDEKITYSKSKMREGSKQATIIKLLKRSGGATIDEMAKATGWQKHSVRGVMSGVLKKRLKLSIASDKEDRGRVYRISI